MCAHLDGRANLTPEKERLSFSEMRLQENSENAMVKGSQVKQEFNLDLTS